MSEHLPMNRDPGPPARLEDQDPRDYQEPFTLRDLEEDGNSILKGILPALKRYWWILVIAAGVGGGAAYYAFQHATLSYEAEGAIWIAADNGGGQVSGPITQGELLRSTAWQDLLLSYEVLDPVVLQERLYLSYAPADSLIFQDFAIDSLYRPGDYSLQVGSDGQSYSLYSGEDVLLLEGSLGGAVAEELGFIWSPPASAFSPDQEVTFSVVTPRDAARSLQNRLLPTLDRQGNFLRLTLPGRNPSRLARVLNAVMNRHVEVAAELKRAKLDELTDILQEQLATVEADLRGAEQSLESYRVQTATLPSAETSPIVPGLERTTSTVYGEFFNLRVAQEQLSRERARLENALAQARSGNLGVESFEMIPAVQASTPLMGALAELTQTRADLRALRERYTDEYAPVAEVLRRDSTLSTSTIPALAESLVDELRAREEDMAELLGSREEELQEIPPRAIEEARRERQYEIANALYIDLQARYENARLAAASSIPDVRILDQAVVPQVPSSDPRIQYALMAFFAPLALGFAVILLLDRFDPRLRDPADIGGDIGLDWLATIPRYRKSTLGKDNSDEIREAFRDLRMKIDFAFGAARPLLLSITSPSEGEGKTFVAANLANAFADLGRKTVLVDGDTRRGDLHHILERKRKPGLTDFLMNGRSHQIIQETDNPKLHFVGFGSRTPTSPELLNSTQMQTLMASLKRRYEVVIFDSPPMAAGSDAFVLGAHAGSVLMVLRSGTTNKGLASAQLESFLRLPVRLLGAVLNDFTPQIGQGYYKYYTHYLPGYEASDEHDDETSEIVG